MPRGRPANLPRGAARVAGDKTYIDESNPCFCGGVTRYVSNAQCVDCAIAKGKTRYASLDGDALAALKAKDHARYEARLRRDRAPKKRKPRLGRPRKVRAVEIERDPLEA